MLGLLPYVEVSIITVLILVNMPVDFIIMNLGICMAEIKSLFNKTKTQNELAFLKQYNRTLESCITSLLKFPKYRATSECVSVIQTHNLLLQNEIARYEKLLEDNNESVDKV